MNITRLNKVQLWLPNVFPFWYHTDLFDLQNLECIILCQNLTSQNDEILKGTVYMCSSWNIYFISAVNLPS